MTPVLAPSALARDSLPYRVVYDISHRAPKRLRPEL